MGVMNKNGLIGIVQNSNTKFSRVLSILNSKSRISARIKNKGYFGNLIWKNLDVERMELEAIPTHASIAIGDTIVTSGYSTMFPQGIQIGTIETFTTKKGASNYSITVKLNNDLSKSQRVFIIDNKSQEIQRRIEEE